MPSAFQNASLLPSLALAVLAAATNGLSLYKLGQISERSGGLTSYGSVAGRISGPIAAAVLDLMIGLFLVGVLAGSFIVLRDWFDSLFRDLAKTRLATALTAVLVVFPLSLPRSVGMLAHAGLLAVCAFALLVGVLFGYGAQQLAAGHAGSLTPVWLPSELAPLKLGTTLNVLVYSFACQFQLMDIHRDLVVRVGGGDGVSGVDVPPPPLGVPPAPLGATPRVRFGAVVSAATCAMLLLGCGSGIFGTLAFGGKTVDGNVLVSLESKPLGGLTYACLASGVALSAPLMLYPARGCLFSIGHLVAARLRRRSSMSGAVGRPDPGPDVADGAEPLASHVAMTAAIVATALTIALLFDRVMVLIGYLAAFVLVPLGFAFPAVAVLRLPPPPRKQAGGGGGGGGGGRGGEPLLLVDVLDDYDGAAANAAVPTVQRGAAGSGGAGRGGLRGCCARHGVATMLSSAWLVLVAVATVAIKVAAMVVGKS